MPHVLFALICAIWGSSFILMKKATLAFSPVSVAAWRVAGGAVVLGLVWFWRRRPWERHRGDWPMLWFVVLVGYAWPYTVQPRLVALHGSALVGMTVSFVPLLTVVVSVPLLRIYPTRRQLLGVVGGLACMGALLADGLTRHVPLANLVLAFSVPLVYALTNVCIRRSLHHVPPLALSFLTLAMASGVLLPISAAAPFSAPLDTAPTRDVVWLAIASLAVLGVLGTGVGTYLFNILVREHGPLFAGMVTYLVPVGALVWGWLDRETITPLQVAALGGIFVMVAIVQYGAAGKSNPVESLVEGHDLV
jgi:drug/metabolite transporter (DMT)-like permease